MDEWFNVRIRNGFAVDRQAVTQTVFHGINKSGSKAAAKVLLQAFAKAGRGDEFFSQYHKSVLSLPQVLQLMKDIPRNACFAGHSLFNAVEPRPGRIYITQFRHPVARAVSVFHWIMHNSQAARSGRRQLPSGTTFRDFIKASVGKPYGAATQIAFGFGANRNLLANALSPREVRYLAMDSLEANIFLHGLAEHFEESLFLYAHLLALPAIPRWQRDLRNKGRPDLSQVSQADLDAIHEIYEDDILFYDWVHQKFMDRVGRIDFGPELQLYKRACAAEYSNRIIKS